MSVKPIFAWYDLWIGAYWDRQGRRLYLLPIPMFGIVIQFAVKDCSRAPVPKRELSLDQWRETIVAQHSPGTYHVFVGRNLTYQGVDLDAAKCAMRHAAADGDTGTMIATEMAAQRAEVQTRGHGRSE